MERKRKRLGQWKPLLTPERRDDGWYLDDRRIEIGDVVKIAFLDSDASTEPHWTCLRVTSDTLDREFDPEPDALQELSLDVLVKRGCVASW